MMTAPAENNESSSVVLMDILKRAHAHVVDAVQADENEYLESAVRSYALAMDYFKTYLKMSEIEKKKYGTRDERQQLVGKIVQYQKRLQKLRRDLMRKKYDEKDEEEKTTTTTTTTTTMKERDENNKNDIEDDDEEEETTTVVVQLTNATTATENEKKERDDALHLETIIEDEELRTLVENSDDREENHASGGGGGDVGSMNSSGSSNSSGKKTTKTLTFDRSLSAMPRLMKTVSVGGSGDAKEDGDDGKRRGGVFDWLLDALDTLDDKIAEKVERAEDAIFDAFEDVQESFKKNFSFRKNTTTDAKENEGKNDGAAADAHESRAETTTTAAAV